MKLKNKSGVSLDSNCSSGSTTSSSPSRKIVIEPIMSSENGPRVSEWYDTDGTKNFMKSVQSGDIVELRNARTSHWGIAIRLRQPPSPNGRKCESDEVMIYHLIHSALHRGTVGQFTIEEFWQPDCRIRINNTTNGMSLYSNSTTHSKALLLDYAFTAHMSTTLKWQTCCDFIRWTCDADAHPISSKSTCFSK